MDAQTRLLSLAAATGLPRLTDEQEDLMAWLAGNTDDAGTDAFADLFRAIRAHAARTPT